MSSQMDSHTTASFLDKTDWRITIHRKLEACVNAEGTLYYPKTVKSLVSAVSATYPGWDAKEQIKNKQLELENIYNNRWDVWLEDHNTARKWQKYIKYKELYYSFCKDIYEYIKDMCATKRMLLWGSKKKHGGTPSRDIDIDMNVSS